MSWLQKLLPPRIKATPGIAKKAIPEGLWVKCPACEAALYRTDLEKNLNVCPKCSHHGRVSARERIEQLLDPDGRYEIGSEVLPIDSLKFKDTRKYPERLSVALEETGETDSLVVMQGSIKSAPLVLAVFEFDFMGGSMGSVVGERFVRGVRVSYENRIPFVCITSSGGARMQEGVSSLFQMAKTTAVLQELTKARLPPFPTQMTKLHRTAVKLSEYGLYALLLGQPVTGLLTTLFGGRPFALYSWWLPPLMPRDEMLQTALYFSHELGAWALAALAVGHAAVALFHHFVLRDDVLECMAPVIAKARSKQELATDYIVRAQNTFRE